LRDETGETSSLTVLERGRLIVADVLESRKYVRVVVPEGLIVPAKGSATGRAMLAFMSRERQIEFLDGKPDADELEEYAAARKKGYAVSSDILYTGFTNIAAPVFEGEGRPVAAVVVAVPTDRASPKECAILGKSVVAAARKLSRGLERSDELNSVGTPAKRRKSK
jgi:IclR family acetate operon transcriptional repressor